MTEYWIPAADLLSAAVIGVCFLIAVIVINHADRGPTPHLGSCWASRRCWRAR